MAFAADSWLGVAAGVTVCLAVAILGLLIALYPTNVNRLLMKSRHQLVDYSDLYIRIFGAAVGAIAFVLGVLIAVLAG